MLHNGLIYGGRLVSNSLNTYIHLGTHFFIWVYTQFSFGYTCFYIWVPSSQLDTHAFIFEYPVFIWVCTLLPCASCSCTLLPHAACSFFLASLDASSGFLASLLQNIYVLFLVCLPQSQSKEQAYHTMTVSARAIPTCILDPRRLERRTASVRHRRAQRVPPYGREFSRWLEIAHWEDQAACKILKCVILTHAQLDDPRSYISRGSLQFAIIAKIYNDCSFGFCGSGSRFRSVPRWRKSGSMPKRFPQITRDYRVDSIRNVHRAEFDTLPAEMSDRGLLQPAKKTLLRCSKLHQRDRQTLPTLQR